jgi:hypothetical protein
MARRGVTAVRPASFPKGKLALRGDRGPVIEVAELFGRMLWIPLGESALPTSPSCLLRLLLRRALLPNRLVLRRQRLSLLLL